MRVPREKKQTCAGNERGNAIIMAMLLGTVVAITTPYIVQSLSHAKALSDDASTSLLFSSLMAQLHSMMENGQSCTDIIGGAPKPGGKLPLTVGGGLQKLDISPDPTGLLTPSSIVIYQAGAVPTVVRDTSPDPALTSNFGDQLRITNIQVSNPTLIPFQPPAPTGTDPTPGASIYQVMFSVTVDKRLIAPSAAVLDSGLQVGGSSLTASFPLMISVDTNAAVAPIPGDPNPNNRFIIGCTSLTFRDGTGGTVRPPVCSKGYVPFGYQPGGPNTPSQIKCIRTFCTAPSPKPSPSAFPWSSNPANYGDIQCVP